MNTHPPLANYSPYRDHFPVEATAVETDDDGKPVYTWVEQQLASDGSYAAADSPRRGGPDGNPLWEINNRSVAVPFYTLARLRGGNASGGLDFEFAAGGSGVLLARCTGRTANARYPAALTAEDGEGGWEDSGACLLTTPSGVPLLPGVTYHCSPTTPTEGDDLPTYAAIAPLHRPKVQLILKTITDGCPAYDCLLVADPDECEVSGQRPAGPCLKAVPHVRGIDLPVYPPPSPLASSHAVSESSNAVGGVPWDYPARSQGDEDGAYATCTLEPGESTERLKLTSLCHAVPTAIIVDGVSEPVEVTDVEWSVTVAADGADVNEAEVKLIVGGAVGGTSQHTATDLDDEDEVRTYSASRSGWGFSGLTVAEVNAADYGLSLRYTNNATASGDDDGVRTVRVDFARSFLAFDPAGEIVPSCVHALEVGTAGGYAVASEPRVEPVRPDNEEDPVVLGGVSYQPGHLRRWDQASKAFATVEDILIIYPT